MTTELEKNIQKIAYDVHVNILAYEAVEAAYKTLYDEYHKLAARNRQLKEEVGKLKKELNEVRRGGQVR